jgi:D-alanyl-D-alanine-carboxypeptidase/D-alanyl-D-alanine-endopeptidase
LRSKLLPSLFALALKSIQRVQKLLLITLLFLPLPLAAQTLTLAQAPAQTLPPLSQAGPLGADLFTRSGSTGMVLVVVRGKQVFFQGYGETALGSGKLPDEKSILRLCSLSKIFATDLLIKLVHDGTLHLDDPLQLFAPHGVHVPTWPGHPITLKDLATHTASLPREVGRAPRGEDNAHFTFPGYTYRWHWLPTQRLKYEPGTQALYSNIGFDFLGDAIQQAAAKPYATLLAERTTTPLGMTETGFTPNPAQCSRLLQGAHDEGPCTDTQNSVASAGVYSTGTDMALWLQYLLGTGAISQDPAAQAVYIDPSDLDHQSGLDHPGAPSGIGLGWMHMFGSDPSAITEKTGGGAGFLTYIALNQTTHTGLFLAVTDGSIETHINVFKNANNILLTLTGFPTIPIPPPPPPTKPHARRTRKRAH